MEIILKNSNKFFDSDYNNQTKMLKIFAKNFFNNKNNIETIIDNIIIPILNSNEEEK